MKLIKRIKPYTNIGCQQINETFLIVVQLTIKSYHVYYIYEYVTYFKN
jgi:hypothetical protein